MSELTRDDSVSSVGRTRERWLVWLVAMCFLVYTDDYIIAGLLGDISSSFDVSPSSVGSLVTVYSVSLAVTAPILSVVFRKWSPYVMLLWWSGLFVVANVCAAVSPWFWALQASRVLAGALAGGAVACAFAVVTGKSDPSRMGRTLGLVSLGIVGSVMVGVPLGSVFSATLGWRSAFVVAGIAAGVVSVGLWVTSPERGRCDAMTGLTGADEAGVGMSGVLSLREMAAVVLHPRVSAVIIGYAVFLGASIPVYTYLEEITAPVVADGGVVMLLFAAGVGGVVGSLLSGKLIDKYGGDLVAVVSPLLGAVAVVVLWECALGHLGGGVGGCLGGYVGLGVTAGAVFLWGLTAFAMAPATQWIIQRGAGQGTGQAMAVNVSVTYVAIGVGVALAGWLLRTGGPGEVASLACLCFPVSAVIFGVRRMVVR